MAFCHFGPYISCTVQYSTIHFLPETGSLMLKIVVDGEEVDRKPLSEASPKENGPAFNALAKNRANHFN